MRGVLRSSVALLLLSFFGICAGQTAHVTTRLPEANATCEKVRALPATQDSCKYVEQNCKTESLIPYLHLYYCRAKPAGIAAEVGFQLFCGFLLILIFRLMGSTAEDFFSPILTQLSQDMGLPPRFAGVSLLALGNGAPDLVSSIAFIKAGKYQVAISGLMGGGMFVGAAVAGAVIHVAQGVKARGALIRDVCWYMLAVAAMAILFQAGKMTWPAAVLLLLLYLLFVAVVLAADIVHIWKARVRGQHVEEKAPQWQPLLNGDISHPPEADLPDAGSAQSIELTEGQPSVMGSEATDRVSWTHSNSAGRESNWSAEAANLTYNEKVHMSGQTYRQMALAEIAHSNTFFGDQAMERARRHALEHSDEEHAGYSYVPPAPNHHEPEDDAPGTAGRDEGGEPHQGDGSGVDQQARVHWWCAEGQNTQQRQPRGDAGDSGRPPDESLSKVPPVAWQIWGIVKAGFWGCNLAFRAAELPFWILRKLTIPLVDNDSYDRQWLIAAAIGSPLAVLWYSGGFRWLPALILLILSAALALAIMYFTAPNKPPEWSCGLPFPVGAAAVATVGFVIAAMWIDVLAGELVALLDYLGTLSGIPHEVLGLTVLAWGNSVGDFSTNTAMARKGLSNMAMTACFAGPIFNLLMSLGLGFMLLFASDGSSSVRVSLQAIDVPAIVIIFANGGLLILMGILHRGWVPGWYGTVPLVLYALYVCMSLSVAFG